MLYVIKHADGTKKEFNRNTTNKAYNRARRVADMTLGATNPAVEKLTREHAESQKRKKQWWLYLPKPEPVDRGW